MTGYRRAAVALHGLDDDDRRWILSELPESDRASLIAYLDELTSLGFTNDEHFGDGLRLLNLENPAPAKPEDCIRHATAVQILSVLEGEPSSLIAQLLAAQQWPWEASFLKMLTPLRRDRIRSEQAAIGTPAPARAGFLIAATARRLQEDCTDSDAAPSARTWIQFSYDLLRQLFSAPAQLANVWKR